MKQLALGVSIGPARCALCGKTQKRPYCKTCTKGGKGEPPSGRKAWIAWAWSLRMTARARLLDAGLARALVEPALDAVFLDRGTVPPEARLHLAPFLARLCSPARYQRALDEGVTGHFLFCRLVELGYDSRKDADPIAAVASARIHDQRARLKTDPSAERVHESDILAVAAAEHLGRAEGLAGFALERFVAGQLREHRARHAPVRVPEASVVRLRVAAADLQELDAGAIEDREELAAEEAEPQTAPKRLRFAGDR